MNKLSDKQVKDQAQAEIRQLIAMLQGSLDASGWKSPASQIEFLLGVCIEPTVETLRQLASQAENPSAYQPGIPPGIELPGLRETV